MMSRLRQLIPKSQKIKIGDIEFDIKPLKFKDLVRIVEMSDKENRSEKEIMEFVIFRTLRDSIPEGEASDEELKEEINNLSAEYIKEIMEVINKVNGLDKKKE